MAKAEGNRRRKALPIVTGFERGCERISNQPNLKRVGLVIFGFQECDECDVDEANLDYVGCEDYEYDVDAVDVDDECHVDEAGLDD